MERGTHEQEQGKETCRKHLVLRFYVINMWFWMCVLLLVGSVFGEDVER